MRSSSSPNAELVTQHWADSIGDAVMMKLGAGPGRVVPVDVAAGGSSPFVLRAGDTMTGNLGIGVALTAWPAGYKGVGVGSAANALFGSTTTGEWFLTSNTYFDGTNYKYSRTDEVVVVSTQTDGSLLIRTGPSGTAGNNVTLTTRLTLDNTGTLRLSGDYVKLYGVGQITSSGWSKGLQLAGGMAIEMDTGVAGTGRYFGMGATSDGNVYLFRSTLNDGTTAPNYVAYIDTAGVIRINAAPLFVAQGGVRWPATPVTSSDPNTMDDYKESTWTPTVSAASGSITAYTVNAAQYTRSGDIVVASVDVTITTKGTAAASMAITMPYSAKSGGFSCGGGEIATTGFGVWGSMNGGNSMTVICCDATSPFKADGNRFYLTMVYKAQ